MSPVAAPPRQLTQPYPGLRPFNTDEAPIFCGRNRHLVQLLSLLEEQRFVAVVGASGCGKSSLVRAGLIPRLHERFLLTAQPGPWHIVIANPGSAPYENLARACQASLDETARDAQFSAGEHANDSTPPHSQSEWPRRSDRTRDTQTLLRMSPQGFLDVVADAGIDAEDNVLLLIDQFEELFRFYDNPEFTAAQRSLARNEATEFVRLLLRTADDEQRPVHVLLTLRSDHIGECDAFDGLPEAISRGQFLTPRPTRDELEHAIVGPLQLEDFQATATRELVNTVLNDAPPDRDRLPLIQHALIQTWRMAKSRQAREDDENTRLCLTLEDYRKAGRVRGALSKHANDLYKQLKPEQRRCCEMMFRSLVAQPDDGRLVRRPQTVQQLADACGVDWETVANVARVFMQPDSNFLRLTSGAQSGTPSSSPQLRRNDELDVSHEALFRQWDRMHTRVDETGRVVRQRGWLDKERDAAREWRRIVDQAHRWKRAKDAADSDSPQEKETAAKEDPHAPALWFASWRTDAEILSRLFQGPDLAELRHWWNEQQPTAAWARRYETSRPQRPRSRQTAAASPSQPASSERLSDFDLAKQFFDASVRYERQTVWKRRTRITSLIMLYLGMLLLAGFAVWSWLSALEQKSRAQKERVTAIMLAAKELAERSPREAEFAYWEAWRAAAPDGARRRNILNVIAAKAEQTGLTLPHSAQVTSAAFSPDGRRIVTTDEDGTARVWDTQSGMPLSKRLEHHDSVVTAAFSPDGTRIITASRSGTTRIWDAESGNPLSEPVKHEGSGMAVTFSHERVWVATASGDGTVWLWDAVGGESLSGPLRHEQSVTSASFSLDGSRIGTASTDGSARVWDISSASPSNVRVTHGRLVHSVAFSLDGKRLVTASEDGTARVWDSQTGTPVSVPLTHDAPVKSASFSPDGTRIVTSNAYGSVRIWNAQNGERLSGPFKHDDWVNSAAFSPDGTQIITASLDATARVWSAEIPAPMIEIGKHDAQLTAASYSPDQTQVLTASYDATARIWDTRSRLSRQVIEQDASISSAAFSPDGTRIVIASFDSTARVWDMRRGEFLDVEFKHNAPVNSAAFSPEGTRIVTASEDNTARVWSLKTGQPLTDPLKHPNWVNSATFSSDGTRIITASEHGTAHVWDAQTGDSLGEPFTHDAAVRTASFSPDGTRIVTASFDWTARVWDAKTGNPLCEPLQHEGWVNFAAFNPDGTRIVTASYDWTARVWDAQSGELLCGPFRHNANVYSAAFSPDGTQIVTAGGDGTARIWQLPPPATDNPDWLRLSVEARTGFRFNPDRDRREQMSVDEWLEVRQELFDEYGGYGDQRTWDQVSDLEKRLISGQ